MHILKGAFHISSFENIRRIDALSSLLSSCFCLIFLMCIFFLPRLFLTSLVHTDPYTSFC